MVVTRLTVPEGTRLAFQPAHGPITRTDEFFDLGLVVLAERHASESLDQPEVLEDDRMVVDCDGVKASELTASLHWPNGEPLLPGVVRYGDHSYPATLQLHARPRGLRAILRVAP